MVEKIIMHKECWAEWIVLDLRTRKCIVECVIISIIIIVKRGKQRE